MKGEKPRKNISVPEYTHEKLRKAAYKKRTRISKIIEDFANAL